MSERAPERLVAPQSSSPPDTAGARYAAAYAILHRHRPVHLAAQKYDDAYYDRLQAVLGLLKPSRNESWDRRLVKNVREQEDLIKKQQQQIEELEKQIEERNRRIAEQEWEIEGFKAKQATTPK